MVVCIHNNWRVTLRAENFQQRLVNTITAYDFHPNYQALKESQACDDYITESLSEDTTAELFKDN